MAAILPDRELKRLIGTSIIDGDEECIKASSYELRLGSAVRFHSTGQSMEIEMGQYLEIQPGELVSVASLEQIDFRRESGAGLFPGHALMGWITPTTTMVREGMTLHSTKIDPGFHGALNWGIRNSSFSPIKLGYGERLFKLTVMRLDADETPELAYGEREGDHYQGTEGIKRSARLIPADIPQSAIVRSDQHKLDPKQQLREAGAPFNHIGTELMALDGKFEVVSNDMRALKSELDKLENAVTKSMDQRLADTTEVIRQKVDAIISERIMRSYAVVIAILSFGSALYTGLLQSAPTDIQAYVFLGVGVLALVFCVFGGWRSEKVE